VVEVVRLGRGTKRHRGRTARAIGLSAIFSIVTRILLTCICFPAAAAAAAQSAETKPFFLVATRALVDPLFEQSVILMLPPQEPPLVAGLIINKRTAIAVRELFPHAPALKNRDDTAFFGGPVDLSEPSVVMRSAQTSSNATRLFEDIYVSTEPSAVAGLLDDPHPAKDLRLILGRAQWTSDQLHAEMMEGSWYMVPATADGVFSSPESIWQTLVRRAQLQEVGGPCAAPPGGFTLLRSSYDSSDFIRGGSPECHGN
jgi:putative transcriptional regulator